MMKTNKRKWTSKDIRTYLIDVGDCLANNKKKYDGLIIYYGGHGSNNDYIILSNDKNDNENLDRLHLDKMFYEFCGDEINQHLIKIPKIFLMACCRGNEFLKSVKIDYSLHQNSRGHG